MINVAPCSSRVLQKIDELSSIDNEPSRLLAADDKSSHERLFLENEVVRTTSTSTDEEQANSSSEKVMLDSYEIGTSTIGINLKVALEIDHEDLYGDITSAP